MLSLQKGKADMYQGKRNRNRKNYFIVLAALLLFIGILFLAKQRDAWQWIEEQWRPIKSWIEEVIEEDSSEEEPEESSKIPEESSEVSDEEEAGEDTQYVPEDSEGSAEAESSLVLPESSAPVEESSNSSVPMEESESSAGSDEGIANDNWGVEDWN